MKLREILKHLVSLLVLIVLLALAAGSIDSDGPKVKIKIGSKVRVSSFVGCTDPKTYERLMDILQRDSSIEGRRAFTRKFMSLSDNGKCKFFSGTFYGVAVVTGYTSGYVRLHIKGEKKDYWTYSGNVVEVISYPRKKHKRGEDRLQ